MNPAAVCASDMVVFDTVFAAAACQCGLYAKRCLSHWDVYEAKYPLRAYLMPGRLFDPGLCVTALGPLCTVEDVNEQA